MSMKAFTKIDRFYLVLIFSLGILILLLTLTLRTIFDSLKKINEVEENPKSQEIHVNQELLDKAYDAVFKKKELPLDFGP